MDERTNTTRIPLSDKSGETVAFALVDAADAAWACSRNWWMTDKGYVRGKRDGRNVSLHRELLSLGPGDPEVDHINGDPLDNRRDNLRVVTHAQNGQNRRYGYGRYSHHRGVSFDKSRALRGWKPWIAYCRLNGRMKTLGYFGAEQGAADAAANYRREHMPFSTEAA